MITATAPARHTPPRWQRELAQAITDPADLIRQLDLDPALIPAARQAARLFPLRVPRGYVARMERGNPNDPLLNQILPLAAETRATEGFGPDPVGDLAARAAPGLLHKYASRALLITTQACAIHCRYCFRREYPYREAPLSRNLAEIRDYLTGQPGIEEVILSGGDPLSLTDQRLGELFEALATLPRLKRLRLHTRQPVVLPERVDDGLLALLAASPLPVVTVIHANHPREIDAQVSAALARLRPQTPLFNQAVLLKGINDRADTLIALSETLFQAGVVPYYLHLLDRVQGAAHFQVEQSRALALMEQLRARLPGYLVPRLAREEAGRPAKTLVF